MSVLEPAQAMDVIVVGGGPVGLAAALALAQVPCRVALVARRQPYHDNRTSALFGQSLSLLGRLGVWDDCAPHAAPLRVMRLVDDTGRLIRAPEIRFHSGDIGQTEFGFNIENSALVAALEAACNAQPGLTRFDAAATAVESTGTSGMVLTSDGRHLESPLIVGADGRQSICRDAAGIALSRKALDQVALTFSVAHARPHEGVSTEFHTPEGPCVVVPLPGNRSSVVWVMRPARGNALLAMDDAALGIAFERQTHSILGKAMVEGPRHLFPLAVERAGRLAAKRIVLAGEAGHGFPPIGAQGLNLGFRDVTDLVRIVADTLPGGDDVGGARLLSRYEAARRADVLSRTTVVDLSNRLLLNAHLPAQVIRAAGVHLLGAFGPLRRLVMREGLSPGWRGQMSDRQTSGRDQPHHEGQRHE